MTLPSDLSKEVDDALALGGVVNVDRHTAQDQLLWKVCEGCLPSDLMKEISRLRGNSFAHRRRDEDATY